MLEYFAYKKYKKNKDAKEATKETQEQDSDMPKDRERRASPDGSDVRPTSPRHSSPRHTSSPRHSQLSGHHRNSLSGSSGNYENGHRRRHSHGSSPASPGGHRHRQRRHEQVLDDDDEEFLREMVSSERREGGPSRVRTPSIYLDSDEDRRSIERRGTNRSSRDAPSSSGSKSKKDQKEKDGDTKLTSKVANRLSFLFKKKSDKLDPSTAVATKDEIAKERNDITNVLDNLNLSAKNNKAFSLSADSAELVRKFTLVLKDIVNGAPTAYNDLTNLLDDRDGLLAKNFDKLPNSMKKLVTQLPDKLTGSLAPEILAAAAKAQGVHMDSDDKSLKGTAKKMLMPNNLQELITKPGAIVGMLRAIMNALKLRWPAFIGTNVIWSVAISLLLFVLWYCHKRGREVRLEREKGVDGSDRIEELPDTPLLPEPRPVPVGPIIREPTEQDLPRPPIGRHSPRRRSTEPRRSH